MLILSRPVNGTTRNARGVPAARGCRRGCSRRRRRGQTRATRRLELSPVSKKQSGARHTPPEPRSTSAPARSARTRGPAPPLKRCRPLTDPRRRADVRSRGSAPAPARRERSSASALASPRARRGVGGDDASLDKLSCSRGQAGGRIPVVSEDGGSSSSTYWPSRRVRPLGPAAGFGGLPRGRGPAAAGCPQDPWAGLGGGARRQRRGGGQAARRVVASS